MEVEGLHVIQGKVVYEVSGYFGPTTRRYFTTEEEAMEEAKRLEKDSWASLVSVVRSEMIYVSEK